MNCSRTSAEQARRVRPRSKRSKRLQESLEVGMSRSLRPVRGRGSCMHLDSFGILVCALVLVAWAPLAQLPSIGAEPSRLAGRAGRSCSALRRPRPRRSAQAAARPSSPSAMTRPWRTRRRRDAGSGGSDLSVRTENPSVTPSWWPPVSASHGRTGRRTGRRGSGRAWFIRERAAGPHGLLRLDGRNVAAAGLCCRARLVPAAYRVRRPGAR